MIQRDANATVNNNLSLMRVFLRDLDVTPADKVPFIWAAQTLHSRKKSEIK